VTQRNRTIAIVGGVILVILVILGITLLATSGDDGDTPSTEAPAATGESQDGESEDGEAGEGDGEAGEGDDGSGGETRPVTVTGDPLPPLESPDDDPAVGLQAPVLDGEEFDGTAITIGEPADGPTMVVFLAHWCPHCNAEIPELIALDEAGRLPGDLNVVGVSTAANPDGENYPPSEWIVEKGWPWPIMVDSAELAAMDAYGGTGFPFTVMLDENGAVVARKSGSGSADEIAEWITNALG
jgi:thiol-disulfide isomerase/thioredoxin